MASCVVWSASCGEGGRVGWGGWFTSLCSYCWLGQNHSSEHLCYGHPGSMHHLNHSRLRVFSRTKKKKKRDKPLLQLTGNRMHARPVPPPLATKREQESAYLGEETKRGEERQSAAITDRRAAFQKHLVHKVRLRNISPFHPSVWCLIFIINITTRIYKTNGTCLIIGPINKQVLHHRNRVGRKSDYQWNGNGVAVRCYICLILKAKIHTVLVL